MSAACWPSGTKPGREDVSNQDQPGPEMSTINAVEIYKETGLSIRYYGATRYVLLPLFLTATAALVSQFFRDDNTMAPMLIGACGLVLSLVFMVYEWSLSSNLKELWAVSGELLKVFAEKEATSFKDGQSYIPHRKAKGFICFQRFVLSAPYVLAVLFWLALLFIPVARDAMLATPNSCTASLLKAAPAATGYSSVQWTTQDFRLNVVNDQIKATILVLTEKPEKFVAQYDCKNHKLISLEKQVDEVKPVPPVVPPLNIAAVQQCLKNVSHDPGVIDGVPGPRTKAALLKLQLASGLPATGLADDETRLALKPCLRQQHPDAATAS